MVGTLVIELARAAVHRFVTAAPAAEDALAALDQIEQVGVGPPYTVALAGDHAARSALLDCLAGEHLFDPTRHDPARIMMTLRRGPATALRARRRDGSVEQRTVKAMLAAVDDAAVVDDGVVAERSEDLPEQVAQGACSEQAVEHRRNLSAPPALHAVVAETTPLVDAIAQAPDAEPTLMVRRPPWWAVWRWLWRWLRTGRSRPSTPILPALAAPPAKSAPPATPAAPAISVEPPAPEVPRPARRATSQAPGRSKRAVDPRRQLVDTLRACFADDAVERIFVEVGGGPLPEEIVVIELPSRANAMALEGVGAADACLVACGEHGFVMTAQLEAMLTIVPHLFVVGAAALPAGCDSRVRLLGSFAAAAPELTRLATTDRALGVGRRAISVLA